VLAHGVEGSSGVGNVALASPPPLALRWPTSPLRRATPHLHHRRRGGSASVAAAPRARRAAAGAATAAARRSKDGPAAAVGPATPTAVGSGPAVDVTTAGADRGVVDEDSRREVQHGGGGRRRSHLPASGGDRGSPAPPRRRRRRRAADCEWRASRAPPTACRQDMRCLPHKSRRARRPAAVLWTPWLSLRAGKCPTPRCEPVQRWSGGNAGQCGHKHEDTDCLPFAHSPRLITRGTTIGHKHDQRNQHRSYSG